MNSTLDIVKLANSVVLTSSGEQVRLGQLWKNQTTVFIFLRHFACIACRAHAKQVWDHRSIYEKSGSKVVFVGNGQPNFIEKFKEDLGLTEAIIVTDPSLESFRAAGFKKNFFYIIHPGTILTTAKMISQGHKVSPYSQQAGHHHQLGGVLVVNKDGKILYHFISEYMGDFPEAEDVMKHEKGTL